MTKVASTGDLMRVIERLLDEGRAIVGRRWNEGDINGYWVKAGKHFWLIAANDYDVSAGVGDPTEYHLPSMITLPRDKKAAARVYRRAQVMDDAARAVSAREWRKRDEAVRQQALAQHWEHMRAFVDGEELP